MNRRNLRRDCWRWEINFITFALRSRHYPRLHNQPITARRAVYIIIAEVAISRSPLRRSIMVNPATARNNKGGSDITRDGVLVIIARTCRRKRKRSSRACPPASPSRLHERGKRRMNTVILLTLLYMRQSKRRESHGEPRANFHNEINAVIHTRSTAAHENAVSDEPRGMIDVFGCRWPARRNLTYSCFPNIYFSLTHSVNAARAVIDRIERCDLPMKREKEKKSLRLVTNIIIVKD